MSPKLATVSGRYYVDCKEKGVASVAKNDTDAVRLWEVSERLVGLTASS